MLTARIRTMMMARPIDLADVIVVPFETTFLPFVAAATDTTTGVK